MSTAEVSREEFLSKLEEVQPGLAGMEIVDQATCFAFQDGKVHTFNEFIACQADSMLSDEFNGAVQSRPLLDVLKRLPDKQLYLSNGGGHLKIRATRKVCRIKMQRDVRLPVHRVKIPAEKEWKDLPGKFTTAVGLTSDVVFKKDANPVFTSIHIHPDWMEASTQTTCMRCEFKTKVPESIIVRGASVKHVVDLAVSQFALTDDFIHFRNDNGTVISCRRFHEKYVTNKKDVSEIIGNAVKTKGRSTPIPTGLDKAVEAAKVFVSENDDKLLRVTIKKGLLKILGNGVSGEFKQDFPLNYDGPSLNFVIQPDILTRIVQTSPIIELNKKARMIRALYEERDKKDKVKFKWTYVATLEQRNGTYQEEYKEKTDAEGDD